MIGALERDQLRHRRRARTTSARRTIRASATWLCRAGALEQPPYYGGADVITIPEREIVEPPSPGKAFAPDPAVIQQLGFALFNGLASGMAIFLVAVGLTWVFGILRLLNLAHGGLVMIGAYVAFTLLGRDPPSLALFLGASVAAGLVVTALGFVVDRVVLSRLRQSDPHYVLIATFALLMLCEGGVKLIWGQEVRGGEPAAGARGPGAAAGLRRLQLHAVRDRLRHPGVRGAGNGAASQLGQQGDAGARFATPGCAGCWA